MQISPTPWTGRKKMFCFFFVLYKQKRIYLPFKHPLTYRIKKLKSLFCKIYDQNVPTDANCYLLFAYKYIYMTVSYLVLCIVWILNISVFNTKLPKWGMNKGLTTSIYLYYYFLSSFVLLFRSCQVPGKMQMWEWKTASLKYKLAYKQNCIGVTILYSY